MAHLDVHSRPINYLRVSVTDRCNLRCVYCMPPEGVIWQPHESVLSFEEIESVVRAAVQVGVSRVRLTGGEPLVRLGIVELAGMIARIAGVEDLSMTTNGVLLPRFARALAEAGLMRVNISLDTLRPERFASMTRLGDIGQVMTGIRAATEAGLEPVKINMVAMRGVNDDELVDMARKTQTEGWNVRFIEWMPIGQKRLDGKPWATSVITGAEIRRKIEAELGPLEPAKAGEGGGPARYYRLAKSNGTLGFITPVSDHFCFRCNRLRLTADGQLRPCLLSDVEIDLRTPLRSGAGVPEIKELLLRAIESKPLRHHLDECLQPEKRSMFQIGG